MSKRHNLQQQKANNKMDRRVDLHAEGEVGVGLNSLREIINFAPERIKKVLLAHTNERSARVRDLLSDLEKLGIEVLQLNTHQLTEISGIDEHQGAIVQLHQRVLPKLEDLLQLLKQKERSTIVLLDGVQDPHNFGAIARVAECFATDALIWPKHRSCGITPTVSKTSAGAIHLLQCVALPNLVQGMKIIKQAGFWVVGASNIEPSVELNQFDFPSHCALLLGAEGEGIQALAEKELDFRVWIDLKGRISSLNVAQAAAVILAAGQKSQLQLS